MNSPGARLKAARKHAGYDTAKNAAEAFGWNVNTYKSHENGKRGLLDDAARRYAKAFAVAASWLTLDENPPAWIGKGVDNNKRVRMRRAPVLAWVAVDGYLSYRLGDMDRDLAIHYVEIDADPAVGRRLFFLPVVGESMIAKPAVGGVSFHDGDLVGFDPDAEHKPGDFVLARLEGDTEPIFRKYQLRGRDEAGGQLIDLVPLNEDYETTRLSSTRRGEIIARLVRHVRNF
jgi:SOS-response transcriptional repressor LexA